MSVPRTTILRFGVFELDQEAEQLRKSGFIVHLPPQPFKLLRLLAGQPGRVVTREEIRAALWEGETFVDFEQGVNFAVKQVREALGDEADRALYIQTVPRRGYRFVAPVEEVNKSAARADVPRTDLKLHKALWANIFELRLADEKRRRRRNVLTVALIIIAVGLAGFLIVRIW
jgi:DNA-binding winged helix-turn-helix (wHTH) protein